MAEKKVKDVSSTEAQLEAMFGKGVMVKASNEAFIGVKEVTPTGSLTLDMATQVGGVPKGGLITHILGKEASGKTTLALHIIANEQKKGNLCAFLDVEGTFHKGYAQSIGVDLENLYLVDTKMLIKALAIKDRVAVSGEEWLDVVLKLLKMNMFGQIILDSVATLTPLEELNNGIAGGGRIARVGSMLSNSLRNVNAHLIGTNTGLILLNQYRISPGKYGNPFVEVGGEALKYYTALKIELSNALDKDADGVHGLNIKAKITKSKIGRAWETAEYYIEFGKGIVKWKEIMNLALEYNIIKKEGNTYSHEEAKLAIGIGKLESFIQDNPDFVDALEAEVANAISSPDTIINENITEVPLLDEVSMD